MYILIALFLFFASSLADATCFRADGVTGDEKWKACNTNGTVSHCCSANDYCLSNGLCLDAGGDNGLSIQGCTDAGWGKPCQLYCSASSLDTIGVIRLWLCGLGGTNAGQYCCGSNPSCCQTTSSYVTNIPLFTSVYKAQAAATSTSDASSTTSATASDSSSPLPSPSSSAKASSDDNRNLAIGLGVGIPLGLFLVAALSFVGLQLRKRNSILSTSGYHAPDTRYETNMDQPQPQDMSQNSFPQPKETYYQDASAHYNQASSSYVQTPQQYQELSDTHVTELPQHPHSPR